MDVVIEVESIHCLFNLKLLVFVAVAPSLLMETYLTVFLNKILYTVWQAAVGIKQKIVSKVTHKMPLKQNN